MFDMNSLQIRYFEVKLKNGPYLQVESPKLKVLKKIFSIAKIKKENINDDSIMSLAQGLSLALSKNKQGKPISADYIVDTMNMDEIQSLLTAYFQWIGEIQNQKN